MIPRYEFRLLHEVRLNDSGPRIGILAEWVQMRNKSLVYLSWRNKAHYFIKVRDKGNERVGGFGVDAALMKDLMFGGMKVKVGNEVKHYPTVDFIIIEYEKENGCKEHYVSTRDKWMGTAVDFHPSRGVVELEPMEYLRVAFSEAEWDNGASTYGYQRIIPASRMEVM